MISLVVIGRRMPTSPVPLIRFTAQAQWAEGDAVARVERTPSPPRWGGEGWGEVGLDRPKLIMLYLSPRPESSTRFAL